MNKRNKLFVTLVGGIFAFSLWLIWYFAQIVGWAESIGYFIWFGIPTIVVMILIYAIGLDRLELRKK